MYRDQIGRCIPMNDKTVTIYNHHKDVEKKEHWQRTVLYGVEYSHSLEKTVTADGKINVAEMLTVVIPVTAEATAGRTYLEYPKYRKLKDTSQYWTIDTACNKDVIVCDYCDVEVGEDCTITEILEYHLKSGTIAGMSDNTGGRFLKHYKVVCK